MENVITVEWSEKDWSSLSFHANWSPNGHGAWIMSWEACPDWARLFALALKFDNPFLLSKWQHHHHLSDEKMIYGQFEPISQPLLHHVYQTNAAYLLNDFLNKLPSSCLTHDQWVAWLQEVMDSNITEQTYRVLVRHCPVEIFECPYQEKLLEYARSMLKSGFLLTARELFFAFPETPKLWKEIATYEELWRGLAVVDDLKSLLVMWHHLEDDQQVVFAKSARKWASPGKVCDWFDSWLARFDLKNSTLVFQQQEEQIRRL